MLPKKLHSVLQKLWWVSAGEHHHQHQKIGYQHQHQKMLYQNTRIRRTTHACAEAWWTDLRLTLWTLIKTTTVHQLVSSVRMSQSQNTLKWQQYCAFKMSYYQRHHSRQDLLNKESLLLALNQDYCSNVHQFQCYINKTMKIELANALHQFTRLKANHHLPYSQFAKSSKIPYSIILAI